MDIGTPVVNTWYMLTLTVDRSTDTIKMYHNGGAFSGSASISGFGSLDGPFGTYFGAVVSGGSSNIVTSFMTMDEISIWNKALTTDDITALYNSGSGLALSVSPATYTLTVTSGTGGGSYTNGHVQAIVASNLFAKTFVAWTGNTQYVASASSASTTVTMPAQAVSLTATYVD
ncbi:MAG: LamG-like jellyroll fold domain-containing protein, partial [Kiritimatiellales bacterium]